MSSTQRSMSIRAGPTALPPYALASAKQQSACAVSSASAIAGFDQVARCAERQELQIEARERGVLHLPQARPVRGECCALDRREVARIRSERRIEPISTRCDGGHTRCLLDQKWTTAHRIRHANSPTIFKPANLAESRAVGIRRAFVLQRDAAERWLLARARHGCAESVLAAIGIYVAGGGRASAGVEAVTRAHTATTIVISEAARTTDRVLHESVVTITTRQRGTVGLAGTKDRAALTAFTVSARRRRIRVGASSCLGPMNEAVTSEGAFPSSPSGTFCPFNCRSFCF